MRIIGYLRVSRVGAREGESFISPDLQRDSVIAYAKAHGHEIIGWAEDLDAPGSTLERAGFQEALALVESGRADGIAGARLDRLTRSLTDLGRLLERARKEGWNLIAVDLGLDLGTSNGELVANLLASIAQWELTRRREGWAEAQENAVGRGIHIASKIPTGYMRERDSNFRFTGPLIPDPVSAPLIREIFRRRGEGASWRDLSKVLNEAGVETPYGSKHWTTSSLSHLVSNRVYLGEARSGRFVNPTAHPAIVTPDEFEAAQSARSPSPLQSEDGGALLAGLLRCAGCRHVMKADKMTLRDGSRARIYRCRGEHASGRCTARPSVLGRVIEPFVVQMFFSALAPDGVLAKSTPKSDEVDRLRLSLSRIDAELDAWRDMDVADLDIDFYREGLRERLERRQAARDELDKATGAFQLPDAASGVELEASWRKFTIGERRAMLASAVDAVMLRKGKNLSIEDRTWFLWRGEMPDGFPRRGHRVELQPFPWPAEIAA